MKHVVNIVKIAATIWISVLIDEAVVNAVHKITRKVIGR